MSNVPPLTPLDWSHARNVIVALPLKLALGTKRIRVLASEASVSAAEVETVGKFCQLLPPFKLNCQVPLV